MIYFDHNATTLMYDEVKLAMQELMNFALNPSSIHANGRKAKAIIENARENILDLANANKKDYGVIFTSGGTESNNLILNNFKDGDILISATEHLSIFGLKSYIPNIKVIKVDENGILDLKDLEDHLKNSKLAVKLVSVMLANNESGVIQPLNEIIQIAKKYGAFTHSDIAQGAGKIKVDLSDSGLDFASISGHKFGGPIGSGALVYKKSYNIKPMLIGGGQERGVRAGTENVIAISGLAKAAFISKSKLEDNYIKMKNLTEYLENNLPANFKVVAKGVERLPNTTLLIAGGIYAQNFLIKLDLEGIMVSSGSACSSGKIGKSHVLDAMNYSEADAKSAIRISFAPSNLISEIDKFLEISNKINKIERHHEQNS